MVKAMQMQSIKRSMSLDAPLIYPALLLLILFALSLFAVDSSAATDGAADTNYFRDSIGGRSGSTGSKRSE